MKANLKSDKFYLWIFALVLAVATAFRAPYLFAQSLWSDEGLYCWLGQRIFFHPSLVFSREVSEFHPPLFAALLALGHVFLPSEMACRTVIFIFYLLGIVTIYYLGVQLKSVFVGTLASMILAFHFSYFYASTIILIDVPLTVFFIIFAIVLLKVSERTGWRTDLGAGLFGCATIFLKSGGALVIPLTMGYYLIALNHLSLRARLRRLFIPCALMGAALALFVLKNLCQFGQPQFWGTSVNLAGFEHFWANLKRVILCIAPPIAPRVFLILGIGGMFGLPWRQRVFLFSWLIIFILGFMSLRIELDSRFLLYVLPCLILMMAISVEEVIRVISRQKENVTQVLKKIAIFTFGILLVLNATGFKKTIHSLEVPFTGYREAALKVRMIYKPGMLVVVGPIRQMRYYTGINFKEFGGDMIGFGQSPEEFAKIVADAPKGVILVVDSWEKMQPKWANAKERENFLKALGFRPTGKIFGLIPKGEGLNPASTIFIYFRDDLKKM